VKTFYVIYQVHSHLFGQLSPPEYVVMFTDKNDAIKRLHELHYSVYSNTINSFIILEESLFTPQESALLEGISVPIAH
jgi:hypothetical protein